MASRVALAANDAAFQPCLISYPPSVCLAMVCNCCRGVHREECTANRGRSLSDASVCVMVMLPWSPVGEGDHFVLGSVVRVRKIMHGKSFRHP